MLLANFNRKEHLRHRAVSLRQHGFLVHHRGRYDESSGHTQQSAPYPPVVIPSLATSVASRLSDSTPAHKALKLAVNARSRGTPHHGWKRPAGRPRTSWIIARSCGTPDSLVTAAGLLPTTGLHGGRYDTQLVTCNSEWVSIGVTSLSFQGHVTSSVTC